MAQDGDGPIGKVLADRFLVLDEIGHGGMGLVYRAVQISVQREIALKLLPASLAGQEDRQTRFRREAMLMAKLRSPHTVTVHDFGVLEDGTLFIAMSLVRGRSLSKLINSEAPLAPLRVARIADQICASLEEAHAAGLVHRDLKPPNVMMEEMGGSEEARVLDFGIAKLMGETDGKLTRAGDVIGTPHYMSPEQCRTGSDEITGRADLYALGVIMFEMLTGKPPFDHPNPVSVLMMQVGAEPPTLADQRLPDRRAIAAFQPILSRCLQKDPAARYANVAELRADLASRIAALSQDPPTQPNARPRTSGKRWALIPLSLTALVLGFVLRGEPTTTALSMPMPVSMPEPAPSEIVPPPPRAEVAPPPPKSEPSQIPAADGPAKTTVTFQQSGHLDEQALRSALFNVRTRVGECLNKPPREGILTLLPNGQLASVAVRPEGDAAKACLKKALVRVSFPTFSGAAFEVVRIQSK